MVPSSAASARGHQPVDVQVCHLVGRDGNGRSSVPDGQGQDVSRRRRHDAELPSGRVVADGRVEADCERRQGEGELIERQGEAVAVRLDVGLFQCPKPKEQGALLGGRRAAQ